MIADNGVMIGIRILILASAGLLAATSGTAQTRRAVLVRTGAERIERVFDLPDAPPYLRGRDTLDLGFLYRVDADGAVSPDAYREGRYVLFAGDRYQPVSDATIMLIEQNIGEDPVAGHRWRVDRGMPPAGTGAVPAGATPAAAKPVWSAGAAHDDAPAQRVAFAPSDDTDTHSVAPSSASLPDRIDNTMLGTATAFILLIVAGFRLAGASRVSRSARRSASGGARIVSGLEQLDTARHRPVFRGDDDAA